MDIAPTEATIQTVGIIGAGVMGQGIAAANVHAGLTVIVSDKTPEDARRGTEAVLKNPDPSSGGVSPPILVAQSDADLASCDLIIEAVTESLPVKRRVLARIESHVRPHTIVASNTSSLRIGEISAGMRHAGRFCGLHFCHPVRFRRLVEVVGSETTEPALLNTASAYVRALGKLPIIVADRPGFIVNRLLMAYFSAAQQLLQEGLPIRSIESAAREFGLECGPFSLMDEFGIDVTARAGRHLAAAYSDRAGNREVLRFLYERGFLGRKSGVGFFRYGSNGSQAEVNPDIALLVRRRVRDGVHPASGQLVERLLLPMVAEARRLLAEEVVCNVNDVNLATLHGFGFPASTGGLLAWAER